MSSTFTLVSLVELPQLQPRHLLSWVKGDGFYTLPSSVGEGVVVGRVYKGEKKEPSFTLYQVPPRHYLSPFLGRYGPITVRLTAIYEAGSSHEAVRRYLLGKLLPQGRRV